MRNEPKGIKANRMEATLSQREADSEVAKRS